MSEQELAILVARIDERLKSISNLVADVKLLVEKQSSHIRELDSRMDVQDRWRAGITAGLTIVTLATGWALAFAAKLL